MIFIVLKEKGALQPQKLTDSFVYLHNIFIVNVAAVTNNSFFWNGSDLFAQNNTIPLCVLLRCEIHFDMFGQIKSFGSGSQRANS